MKEKIKYYNNKKIEYEKKLNAVKAEIFIDYSYDECITAIQMLEEEYKIANSYFGLIPNLIFMIATASLSILLILDSNNIGITLTALCFILIYVFPIFINQYKALKAKKRIENER